MNKTEATPCPTCGTPCTIQWSGLELAENTGDETVATKGYVPVQAVNNYDRLVNGIEKYVLHWDKFFGDPKVGQPPDLNELRSLLNDIKKP